MVEAVNVGESGGVGRWYSKGKGCSLGRRARLQAELAHKAFRGFPLVFNMNLINRQSQRILYFISLVFVGLSIVTYYHKTVAS